MKGGLRKLDRDCEYFQEIIDNMVLVDINIVNDTYTLNNKRGVDRKISSRLDRFLSWKLST